MPSFITPPSCNKHTLLLLFLALWALDDAGDQMSEKWPFDRRSQGHVFTPEGIYKTDMVEHGLLSLNCCTQHALTRGQVKEIKEKQRNINLEDEIYIFFSSVCHHYWNLISLWSAADGSRAGKLPGLNERNWMRMEQHRHENTAFYFSPTHLPVGDVTAFVWQPVSAFCCCYYYLFIYVQYFHVKVKTLICCGGM